MSLLSNNALRMPLELNYLLLLSSSSSGAMKSPMLSLSLESIGKDSHSDVASEFIFLLSSLS